MRKFKKGSTSTGFLDLLFNTLLLYVFLFIIAFVLIVPERKDSGIKTQAEFIVTLTWADASKDDVDIWVRDPLGNMIWYNNKENGLMHLDRDDLGSSNDVARLPNGQTVVYKHNQEIVTIRGFIPGEWIINVHMYNKNDKNSSTPVIVQMIKLNPSYTEIFRKEIVMETYWEEVTMARFTMTEHGSIVEMSELYEKLIKSERTGVMQTTPPVTPGATPGI
jgi:hypothetical protein